MTEATLFSAETWISMQSAGVMIRLPFSSYRFKAPADWKLALEKLFASDTMTKTAIRIRPSALGSFKKVI